MNIDEAQENMRYAYFGGGPGIFASGLVWLVAGSVALFASVQAAALTLFIGGMFIHPLGMLLSKLLKRPGTHEKGNPLANLALESTFLLFIGIFIAFSIMQMRPAWFSPIMLMVIGGRYLLFSTVYGLRIYWAIGGILAMAGVLSLLLQTPLALSAFIGGSLEIAFSFLAIYLARATHSIEPLVPIQKLNSAFDK